MSSENHSTLIGNVTRDPELRFTPSGQAVVEFGMAVNRRWLNQSTQEWDEATSFFNVTAWRDLAENVSESVAKGMRVIVVGRFEQNNWETPEGEKRSRIAVVADDVGPALRYATAVVTKAARTGPGASKPTGNEPTSVASSADDEEPF